MGLLHIPSGPWKAGSDFLNLTVASRLFSASGSSLLEFAKIISDFVSKYFCSENVLETLPSIIIASNERRSCHRASCNYSVDSWGLFLTRGNNWEPRRAFIYLYPWVSDDNLSQSLSFGFFESLKIVLTSDSHGRQYKVWLPDDVEGQDACQLKQVHLASFAFFYKTLFPVQLKKQRYFDVCLLGKKESFRCF